MGVCAGEGGGGGAAGIHSVLQWDRFLNSWSSSGRESIITALLGMELITAVHVYISLLLAE